MTRLEFCRNFIYLKGALIKFDQRPYLPAIYEAHDRRIVLRCSRQVEKTTFLCNMLIHTAFHLPGVRIIVVFPRMEQAHVFSKSRLMPMIESSPIIARKLLGQRRRKTQVMHMRFANDSEVFIRAAFHSADAARGIDGDFLFIDEFQDISNGDLPVLEEALSHSPHRRVFLTGTPKSIDNHLEGMFNASTANEWRVDCPCGHLVFLDERVLGPHFPICPECQTQIDPTRGRWVPRNPDSLWGAGFSMNHLVTPWLVYQELMERHRTYNPALFRNECMGLSTALGDHVVTREDVEACCTERSMATRLSDVQRRYHGQLVAGVDWGGGAVSSTVLVIGFLENDIFHIVFLEKYHAMEEPQEILEQVARRCREFQIRCLAADGGGNGNVYNNLLLNSLPPLERMYAVMYSSSDQPPHQYKGRLHHWTIGRSASLGMVFTRIRKGRVQFPRLADCSEFLPEIWCEIAEYDDQQRSIRYTKPDTQNDDALHAINYASTLARMMFDASAAY